MTGQPAPEGAQGQPQGPALGPMPLSPGGIKKWPFPDENSLVGETEALVRLLARGVANDAKLLAGAVMGKEGRPFGHVRLSPLEQRMVYERARQADDPAEWAGQLRGGKVRDTIKRWQAQERDWRGVSQEEPNGNDAAA